MANEQPRQSWESLADIADHHATLKASIVLYHSRKNPSFEELFASRTPLEIRTRREETLYEASMACTLTLLAWIEGSFHSDYRYRVRTRKKDSLSRAFYDLYRQKRLKVSFTDNILQLWKVSSNIQNHVIGEIRAAFKYRHWLAHGRHWYTELHRQYDFETVYDLANIIDSLFPLFPRNLSPRSRESSD